MVDTQEDIAMSVLRLFYDYLRSNPENHQSSSLRTNVLKRNLRKRIFLTMTQLECRYIISMSYKNCKSFNNHSDEVEANRQEKVKLADGGETNSVTAMYEEDNEDDNLSFISDEDIGDNENDKDKENNTNSLTWPAIDVSDSDDSSSGECEDEETHHKETNTKCTVLQKETIRTQIKDDKEKKNEVTILHENRQNVALVLEDVADQKDGGDVSVSKVGRGVSKPINSKDSVSKPVISKDAVSKSDASKDVVSKSVVSKETVPKLVSKAPVKANRFRYQIPQDISCLVAAINARNPIEVSCLISLWFINAACPCCQLGKHLKNREEFVEHLQCEHFEVLGDINIYPCPYIRKGRRCEAKFPSRARLVSHAYAHHKLIIFTRSDVQIIGKDLQWL